MADDCVTRHPVQLVERVGGREDSVTESLRRIAAFGRLVHEKNDFAHHASSYADRAMSCAGATAGTLALMRRNASRSRTLSQQAGHWWNSRSGMVYVFPWNSPVQFRRTFLISSLPQVGQNVISGIDDWLCN